MITVLGSWSFSIILLSPAIFFQTEIYTKIFFQVSTHSFNPNYSNQRQRLIEYTYFITGIFIFVLKKALCKFPSFYLLWGTIVFPSLCFFSSCKNPSCSCENSHSGMKSKIFIPWDENFTFHPAAITFRPADTKQIQLFDETNIIINYYKYSRDSAVG